MFAVHFCCQPSVVLTALESRSRRLRRTEFCDFLVCPEFLLKRRLLFGRRRPELLHSDLLYGGPT